LNANTELAASNGQSIKALAIFAHALRFFRNHAIQELADQSQTRILDEDIRWIISVPAIWKEPAKQFMRQAAYQVSKKNLILFNESFQHFQLANEFLFRRGRRIYFPRYR